MIIMVYIAVYLAMDPPKRSLNRPGKALVINVFLVRGLLRMVQYHTV